MVGQQPYTRKEEKEKLLKAASLCRGESFRIGQGSALKAVL